MSRAWASQPHGRRDGRAGGASLRVAAGGRPTTLPRGVRGVGDKTCTVAVGRKGDTTACPMGCRSRPFPWPYLGNGRWVAIGQKSGVRVRRGSLVGPGRRVRMRVSSTSLVADPGKCGLSGGHRACRIKWTLVVKIDSHELFRLFLQSQNRLILGERRLSEPDQLNGTAQGVPEIRITPMNQDTPRSTPPHVYAARGRFPLTPSVLTDVVGLEPSASFS